jgi:hypothetical protein
MYTVLIIEILIKFTIATLIILMARPKINTPFHIMNTRTLGRRQVLQFFMPKYDVSALARRCATFFPDSLIIGRHMPHNGVEATGCAIKIDSAIFSPNYPGLHPNAGILFTVGVLLHAGGIHMVLPFVISKVIGYWLLVISY